MVMRLFPPLHAHPASHSRSPEPYQRKQQKGTTAARTRDLNLRRTSATKNKSWLNVENNDQHVYERVRW
jgi:hypothetical protein